jgi:hypothetical protein
MFEPFKQDKYYLSYVLYVLNDGTYTTEKTQKMIDDADFNVWRISKCDNGNYCITFSEDYFISEVYIGKIPSREFFVELMKNIMEGFDVDAIKSREDGTIVAYKG